MCRAQLLFKNELVEPRPEVSTMIPSNIDTSVSSSKLEALLNILKASARKPGTKTIIFSQWTSCLNIVSQQLVSHGFKYCRLDGSMKPQERDDAIEMLNKDPECTIMLASLAVASVGLNLVAANTVVLLDSWWAPAIEVGLNSPSHQSLGYQCIAPTTA